MIQEKLKNLGVYIEDIPLGDFDVIGEYTAKKIDQPIKNFIEKSVVFLDQTMSEAY